MKHGFSVACLALAACRFGGADGDALALIEPEVDAAVEAGAPPQDSGAMPSAPPDASSPSDAQPPPSDAGAVSDAGEGDAVVAEGGVCVAVALPGCDPVRNEGCSDGFTQCVVDPTVSEPTGHCVVAGLPVTPCSESIYSTSCAPQHTCVAGECRRFCSCDEDCPAGEACGEILPGVESGEVRLCAAVP